MVWGCYRQPVSDHTVCSTSWAMGVTYHFFPHLCVGFFFLILYPAPGPDRRAHSVTHHFVTHPSFTHNFVTHHLSPLCHTLSFTHNLSPLCHTLSFTHHLSHTLSHTISHPLSHDIATHHLCMAGVALGDIDVPFAWQAWHLVTLTFHLRGKRGTCGTGLALVARLGAVSRPRRRAILRGRCGIW